MLYKIISIILIMSFNSILLSNEGKTTSEKEKSKSEEIQIKEKPKNQKEIDKINRKEIRDSFYPSRSGKFCNLRCWINT